MNIRTPQVSIKTAIERLREVSHHRILQELKTLPPRVKPNLPPIRDSK